MQHPESSLPSISLPTTSIELHPISALYRLGLVAVAVGLMLLPVIYFALVAGVVWAVYWHFQHIDWYMRHLSGLWGFTVLLAPILTGMVIVFFMSRPFFLRRQRPAQSLEITADTEPVLFEFIGAICKLLNAPFPKRVYVDWQVNASASLHRGLRSFFNRDLDLTIGLPLSGALSVGQFGGVLAHEFGHFAQGAGMRFSYLIRTMNAWLARVAYQPGDIETKLAQSEVNRNVWGLIVVGMARLGLWTARWALHGLTLAGHAISCFSLRQMEYDADLYEAKIAGCDAFAAVMRQLRFLEVGWQSVNFLVWQNLMRNQLPRDLSALTIFRTEAAVNFSSREITRTILRERSSWLSTHPSFAERIEHVRGAGVLPALVDPRSATELFRDFVALSEKVTLQYYREMGVKMDDVKLSDIDQVCDGYVLTPARLAAVREYFADRLTADRPLLFGPDPLREISPTALTQERLRENRQTCRAILEQTEGAFDRFHAARASLVSAERACWLKQARVRFKPAAFLLASRSRAEIAKAQAAARATLSEVEADLARFETAAINRLLHALRLACIACESKETVLKLLAALEKFRPVFALLPALRTDFAVYVTLYPLRQSQSPRRKAHALRLELGKTLNQQLSGLDPLLRDVLLPHRDGEPMRDQLKRRLPEEPIPFEMAIYRDVSVYLEEIDTAYYRIVGDLSLLAQKAELSASPPQNTPNPAGA